MNNIAGFLQKFLNLEKDNNTKLFLILDIIKKETNISLEKSMLEIKGESIKINSSPIFRNEIFMHREKIEEELQKSKIFLKLV
ncbi:MAG: hypothetical protein WC657_00375 [Candidatus Paceibacterota bacterium]|jgi:hypothetical protein